MNYTEVEEYFQTENLDGLLKACQTMFDLIDSNTQLLISNRVDSPISCQKMLEELCGVYGFLRPVHAVASTVKKDMEEREYHNLKINTEGKFVSTVAEKEASRLTQEYRRVRNIVEAYVNICEKLIGVGQSLLKSLQEEKNASS